MKNTYLKNAEKVRSLWEDLKKPWAKVVDNVRDDELETFWRKSCRFFSVYLFEVEPTKWGIEFMDHLDLILHQQDLTAGSQETAETEADEIISEFVCRGFEALSGFTVGMERPHNEVRFVHLANGIGNQLYGVTKDGVVYEQVLVQLKPFGIEAVGWKQCVMKVVP